MQIAPITATALAAAPSMSAPSTAPAHVPSANPRIEGTPQTVPAAEFNRKHALDYLAMPGVYTVGWGSRDFNEFYVNTKTEAEAALLAGVLERQVGDIKVVIKHGPDRTPWTGTPDTNMGPALRGIAAMPGVWMIDQRGVHARGGSVSIRTIDQGTIDRLDPLLVDRLYFGRDRKGVDLYVRLNWRAGIPA